MEYTSERVVNISVIEDEVSKAMIVVSQIQQETKKEKPSISQIEDLSGTLFNTLQRIKSFEFVVERRTTIDNGHPC